jgi:transcriptional regulator with XRE-family HTH domain
MPRKHRFESAALRHAYEEFVGDDTDQQRVFDEELANLDIARKLYDLRVAARLTQSQLAKRVGTTASAISRLEDASYDGHSLTMLQRIAAALNKRVTVSFVSVKSRRLAFARRLARPVSRTAARRRRRKTA